MKGYCKIVCLLALVISSGSLAGQALNGIIESLGEGEVLVLSNTSKETVKYQAVTIAEVSIDNCLEVMRETMIHTAFIFEASFAEKIKTISADEWLNYYRFDGACGMPDYDGVFRMQYFENKRDRSFAIKGTSCSSCIEDKGVARIESYEILCMVREVKNGLVEITISAEYTPIFPAPDRKIEMCFPQPTTLLEGITSLAASL